MPHQPSPVSRRQFLASTAATAAALALRPAFGQDAAPRLDLSFWHVSDTHFLADATQPGKLDDASRALNSHLIDLLNTLPGTELPQSVGGGALPKPVGVIHTGDMIDTGDKNGAKFADMQKTEWAAYEEHFGLTGADGKLKYPVYELHGNHDAPQGKGLAIDGIVRRNQRRPGVTHVSKNGLHYSWDWQTVHFVSLGITVGSGQVEPAAARRRHFDPRESLDFLATDLAEKVGKSGRPVVLCHHIDIARYTGPCEPVTPAAPPAPAAAAAPKRIDWDPCDVHAFHKAIAGYNVVAILYGHTHGRKVYKWDGQSTTARAGLNVFNVDDASHFKGPAHGILHYHLTDKQMTVREYATKDHWKTAAWTQAWTLPLA